MPFVSPDICWILRYPEVIRCGSADCTDSNGSILQTQYWTIRLHKAKDLVNSCTMFNFSLSQKKKKYCDTGKVFQVSVFVYKFSSEIWSWYCWEIRLSGLLCPVAGWRILHITMECATQELQDPLRWQAGSMFLQNSGNQKPYKSV